MEVSIFNFSPLCLSPPQDSPRNGGALSKPQGFRVLARTGDLLLPGANRSAKAAGRHPGDWASGQSTAAGPAPPSEQAGCEQGARTGGYGRRPVPRLSQGPRHSWAEPSVGTGEAHRQNQSPAHPDPGPPTRPFPQHFSGYSLEVPYPRVSCNCPSFKSERSVSQKPP